jgi:predicted nucleic acid-binding protein
LTGIVVDASVAPAWCFPDEGSGYAEGILVALEGKAALVPAIWPMEIANAISVAERNKRLSQPDVRRFLTLLRSLSLITDAQPVGELVDNVLSLAREYSLSAYDAAYLELAIRHHSSLATLDLKLQKAARNAGIPAAHGKSG